MSAVRQTAFSESRDSIGAFAAAALQGLSAERKALSPKWFYDARGSDLFEAITDLPEYYPTRTEIALLEAHAPAMVDAVGPRAVVLEWGSGSSRKTPIVLRALNTPQAYAPIDVSASALAGAAVRVATEFPGLQVMPIEADFTRPFAPPPSVARLAGPRLGFFPGSTIGNLEPTEAIGLLRNARSALGDAGLFLLGVDAPKDEATLLRAYADPAGVTAAFNLNLIHRLNRELNAGLEVDGFRHEARWNRERSRIEMHLVATRSQTAHIAGRRIVFRAGESIHTENSHKLAPEAVAHIAGAAGWKVERSWMCDDPAYGVYRLRAA